MEPSSSPAAEAAIVTICIVAYNSRRYLHRVIECLERQTEMRWRLVVVDNASNANERPDIQPALTMELRQLEENIGFAAANNLVGLHCATPYFATLNPDAFPEPDWLAELLAAAQRYSHAAAFGSTQRAADDPGCLDGAGDKYFFAGFAYRSAFRSRRPPPPEGETFSACAAAALYRSAEFRAVGGFDESFFCYQEDVDLGFRLRLAGRPTIQVASAVVDHVGDGSGASSDFKDRLSARNRVWTMFQNMPSPLMELLFPVHLALALVVALTHATRGRFGSWRGLVEALTLIRRRNARRREVQALRNVRLATLMRSFSWSPLSFIGKR